MRTKPKRVWVLLVIAASLMLGYPLIRYGTVSPCGILKKKYMGALARTYADQGKGLGLLALAVARPALDALVAGSSPATCFQALVSGEADRKIEEAIYAPERRRREEESARQNREAYVRKWCRENTPEGMQIESCVFVVGGGKR